MTGSATNRAIDRHEDAIVRVLGYYDEGCSPVAALHIVAFAEGLTSDRLHHLVNAWCAVAGTTSPLRED